MDMKEDSICRKEVSIHGEQQSLMLTSAFVSC